MLRIVVADDEQNVRDIVADYINKSEQGLEVVGRAENGSEALAMVQEHRPDILITDICMPGMDGIGLITELKRLGIEVHTLVISGYNDFAYAKSAISLGVADYLLKPFMPNELMEALEKIKSEIEKQAMLQQNLETMQDTIDKNLSMRREDYIRMVISQDVDELSMIEEGKAVDVDLNADMYCVCVIQAVELAREKCGREVLDQLFNCIKETYFDSRIRAYTAQMQNDSNIVVLFCGEFQNNISFKNGIYNGLLKICESVQKYYNIHFQCAVGTIYHDWAHISNSYREASIIWKGSLENLETITYYENYIQKSTLQREGHAFAKPVQLEKNLIVQIQMARREDAVDTLHQIIEYYSSFTTEMEGFVSVSLMELVLSISDTVVKAGGDLRIWEDANLVRYLREHFQYGSLLKVKSVFEEYILKCCDEFSRLNKKQSDKIVYAVKEMIEKNIANEDFSIDTISSELFFSIHYIRQVFKQKNDENILEYLIKRRMEVAKELLLDEKEYKIAEVAERTGYKNPRYFSTTFKKYYGCTPSEIKTLTEKGQSLH